MKAYFKEIEEQLNRQYAHLKDFVPQFWLEPKLILLTCCSDGLVVRFDKTIQDRRTLMIAFFPKSIFEAVSALSNNLIHLHKSENYIPDNKNGIGLNLSTTSLSGNTEFIASLKIRFDAVLKQPEKLPLPPQKPFCLISVQNTLELQLHGLQVPENTTIPKDLTKDLSIEGAKPMVIVTELQLPVGWDCIQVYPYYDLEHWRPEYAPIWAERDLLAAATSYQLREQQLHTLDPNADARRKFEQLFQAFKSLLDSNPEREEVLQQFLKENPSLLCPSYIKLFPKLALGNHITDFVFREATGDYLLVELERSTLRLFKNNGDLSADLNHALGQITDWKRYIEDNLPSIQRELGLTEISSNPKSLVVIGRSQTLSSDNKRKLATIENERPKTKILTYDDVLQNAKVVVENLLGPISAASGQSRVFYK